MKKMILLAVALGSSLAAVAETLTFETYVGPTGGTTQYYYFTVPANTTATVTTEVRNLQFRVVSTNTTYSVYGEVWWSPLRSWMVEAPTGTPAWVTEVRMKLPMYKATSVTALNTGSYYVYDGFANSLVYLQGGSQIGGVQVQPGPGTGTYWGGSGYNHASYDLPPGDYMIVQAANGGAMSYTVVNW